MKDERLGKVVVGTRLPGAQFAQVAGSGGDLKDALTNTDKVRSFETPKK